MANRLPLLDSDSDYGVWTNDPNQSWFDFLKMKAVIRARLNQEGAQ